MIMMTFNVVKKFKLSLRAYIARIENSKRAYNTL